MDTDLDALNTLVDDACSTSHPLITFCRLTVQSPRTTARGLVSVARLPRYAVDPGRSTLLDRRLRHRRGPFPTGRLAVAVAQLPEDAAELLTGRARQAWRTNLRHARRCGITCRRVTDPAERRAQIDELAEARGWGPHTERYLAAQHGLTPYTGEHFVAVDAAGAVLAVAVLEVVDDVAFLVWQESAHTETSTWARYALHHEAMQWLVERSATALVAGSTFGLAPGLRYFQRRLGFAPYNVRLQRRG